MHARLLLALVLLTPALSGCIVPENMAALREELGYTSVDLADVVAKARASTLSPRVHEDVTFTAEVEGVSMSNATIEWSIGGTDAAGQQVTHVFTEPGPVPVNLAVEGPQGSKATDALTVEVQPNALPEATIAIEDRGNLTAGTPVTISAAESTDPDGDELAYSWVVDGEQVSKDARFSKAFAPGVHEVELTLDDGIDQVVAFDAFAIALPIEASGTVSTDEPTLTIPFEATSGVDAVTLTLEHSTNAGLDDVRIDLLDGDGETVASAQTEPDPGASTATETLEVDGSELPEGSYTVEATLERGVDSTVTIEGVLTYSALAGDT